MPSTTRQPEPSRSSSLSFPVYGPPQTEGYLGSLNSTVSGGSKQSTLKYREETPKAPPVIVVGPTRPPYANAGTIANLQRVRFNASPKIIQASPLSEYGTIRLGEDPEARRAFIAADTDGSGLIDRSELQTALVNSPWNKPFEAATIDMLINIFDLNKNKQIEYREFLGLSKYVKEWRDEFEKADRDRSGTIDAEELRKALKRFGYRLPLQTVKMLHRKHASHSGPQRGDDGITFDQFMRACIAVQDLGKTFEQFNGRRDQQHGSNFENFVLSAVSA